MIDFRQNWGPSWILTLFMLGKLFKTYSIMFDTPIYIYLDISIVDL